MSTNRPRTLEIIGNTKVGIKRRGGGTLTEEIKSMDENKPKGHTET